MLRVKWEPDVNTKEVTDEKSLHGEVAAYVGDGGYTKAVIICDDKRIRSVEISKLSVV